MKYLLPLLVLSLSGCQSTATSNASSFVKQIAALNVSAADISQSTTTPVYSHSESATGVAWSPDGFSVLNVKATIGIPFIGTNWSFSASSLQGGQKPPVIVNSK